jgi:hypothetical protein
MKTSALLIAALALTASVESQANGGIDLKQIIKQGVDKGMGKEPASATATANGGGTRAGAAAPTAASMPASLLTPGGPDIAGIRVGLTANEARQAVQKLNPGYKFIPIIHPGSKREVGFQASVGANTSDPKGADFFSVLFNEGGTVWAIKRDQALPPSKAILKDTLVQSLKTKYDQPGGQVMYRDKITVNMAWVYDMAGKQIASFSTNFNYTPCREVPYSRYTPISDNISVYEEYAPTCAMAITIDTSALRTGNPDMLDRYAVQIVAPPLLHDVGTLNAEAAAREQQKKNLENTVRDNKPQL